MINVNIRDRQCAMPECTRYPSCNFPGSTDGLYCGAWLLSGCATPCTSRNILPRGNTSVFSMRSSSKAVLGRL